LSAKTTPENRSMPSATVIPVLAYDDVREATEWICAAFGFEERLRIGEHRVQLVVGDGAVIVNKRRAQPDGAAAVPIGGHEIMVRVDDVDSHYERAQAHGARILQAPTNFPYGERQYGVADPGGHVWTFSQTIADVAPEEWGGALVASD
jgi:uncharacterized glyoxalase superfamily protein PhnB